MIGYVYGILLFGSILLQILLVILMLKVFIQLKPKNRAWFKKQSR